MHGKEWAVRLQQVSDDDVPGQQEGAAVAPMGPHMSPNTLTPEAKPASPGETGGRQG